MKHGLNGGVVLLRACTVRAGRKDEVARENDSNRKCEERPTLFRNQKSRPSEKPHLHVARRLIFESQRTVNFTANGRFGDTSLAARRYLG